MSKLSFLVCFRDTVGGWVPPYDSEALNHPLHPKYKSRLAPCQKAGAEKQHILSDKAYTLT